MILALDARVPLERRSPWKFTVELPESAMA
jgi:hypothetical protein